MRVSEVRKKYPEFFVIVETAVWDDIRSINLGNGSGKKYNSLHIYNKTARRISYNAAAVATLELHKILKMRKTAVKVKKVKKYKERWQDKMHRKLAL